MKTEYKSKIGSLYIGYYHPCLKFCPEFYFDGKAKIIIAFLFFQIFIYLPFGSGRNDESEWRQYGFYCYNEGKKLFDTIVLCFGDKSHTIYMPWYWEWVRTSALRIDGNWEHETRGHYKGFYSDEYKSIIRHDAHPYYYKLRNGDVQNRTATIRTEEREWRWKWFVWLKYPRIINRAINVEFNDEVGEETGSWKGGTIGCSYKMLPNETPEQCLRRMEKDRKF